MRKGIPHMRLTDSRLKELENPSLTNDQRILLRCHLASEFIHIGQYETAREALGDFWQGIGKRPNVDNLKRTTAANVLLQCGVLSGWLGKTQHTPGAQEQAKDLLSESLRTFQRERQPIGIAEAQYELGMCYYRLGAYDEARDILNQALSDLAGQDTTLQAKILIRQSIVEVWTGRYRDAWDILERAREFFETSSDALKGRWHGQRGLVLRRLSAAERRRDYIDRAVMEYTASTYHYELAGHERYCATNLNNLGFVLYKLGRHGEAHEHLERALKIFERHRDTGNIAQVNETKARVLIAERFYKEANRIIASVVQTFEKGSEYAMLADALTLQGIVWARMNLHDSSLHILRHAMNVAQDAGAYSNAGRAALTLIEEHGVERLQETELADLFRRADELLKDTEDPEEIVRIRSCARIIARRLTGIRASDKGFYLPKAVHDYEARFIREALEAEQGVVSRAAKRLGIRHQSLVHALNHRHKALLGFRTPPRIRGKTRRKKG